LKKNNEIIKLAEAKRQEIVKLDEFLSDTRNYKHDSGPFYANHSLNESIQQAELSNIYLKNFNIIEITVIINNFPN
jgi:hypothetical protein